MATAIVGGEWMRASEARKILGIGRRTLDRLVAAGKLSYRHVAMSYPQVRRAEVMALAEKSTQLAEAPAE